MGGQFRRSGRLTVPFPALGRIGSFLIMRKAVRRNDSFCYNQNDRTAWSELSKGRRGTSRVDVIPSVFQPGRALRR